MVAHGAQRHVGGQRVGTVLRLRCGRRGSRNGIGSIAGIARIANISAMFRTVVRFRVNSGAHVVIRREEAAQRFVKAEVAYFHAVFRMRHVSKTGDARVLTVEHDGTGGGFRSFGQQSRGVVDLAETVKLVAHHVEQQAVVGRHLLDEMHGVRLVEFQHRDVGVEFAGKRDFRKQRRNHATGEVRAGRVGEHLQSERLHMLATMRVVVVLPFVPETSTTPSGSCANVRDRNCGSMRSTILPGNALPPPCAKREAARTALPINGVAKEFQAYHTASCWDW